MDNIERIKELRFDAQKAILVGSMTLTKAALLNVSGESEEFQNVYAERVIDCIDEHFGALMEIAAIESQGEITEEIFHEVVMDPEYITVDLEFSFDDQASITRALLGMPGTFIDIAENSSLKSYYTMYYAILASRANE